jgi:hypothetical protein
VTVTRTASRAATNVVERLDRASGRRLDLIALGLIVVGFLLPLHGLLQAPGPPMEEGFMLVFPERVLEGDLPNKDFLHLYGPGSLWVLAAVYKVFGTTLLSERMFGLLQEMAVVFGVFFLARRWGRTAGLACASISLLFVIAPHGLTALAWVGGVALGLFALVAAVSSRESTNPGRAGRLALVAGLLAGFALLYRHDLVIALTLSLVAIGWGTSRAVVKRFALGLGIGLAPYLVHVITAGPGNVWNGMVIQPIFDLRGGRHLPIPPPWNDLHAVQYIAEYVRIPWPIPRFNAPGQISLWFFLLVGSVLFVVLTGIWAVRRDRIGLRPRVFLAAALFSAGLLPQAFQRADTTHLAWVAAVAMALVPLAVLEILRVRRPSWSIRRTALVSGGAVLLAFGLLIPNYTFRSYADYSVQLFGIHEQWAGHEMRNRGRVFYTGRADDARGANAILADVEKLSRPGDRLLVGTKDLRKTPLSEAFFYYLLPQLEPSTYYIEMDPGVANAEDSGLAEEVRSSDILILSTAWSYWDEPNDSRKFGSDKPNQVVRDEFCLYRKYPLHAGLKYFLYTKCDNPRI